VVVAGSLHRHRHQKSFVDYVRRNRGMLHRVPNVLVSVSLTAVHADPRYQAAAQACVDRFVRDTDWRPQVTWLMRYSRYGPIKKWMVRRIAAGEGGDTDTSRDQEYTDWEHLRHEVEALLEPLDPINMTAEAEAAPPG
jgi:menaquinone-dependent protoporphyrinogen oxidase